MLVPGQVEHAEFQMVLFHVFLEYLGHGLVHDFSKDLELIHRFLAEGIKLDFPRGGSIKIVQVRHAGDRFLFAQDVGSASGVRDHRFIIGDRKAGGDSRFLVHVGALAGFDSDLLDDFGHEIGDHDLDLVVGRDPGFLKDNLDSQISREGVMGSYFRADTVLELSDDFSRPCVFFGVGGEEKD